MKFAVCEECGNKLTPESMHCLSCGAPANHDIPTEVRCECGFLLCMLGEETVEVKCRRCKRIVYIPIEGIEDRYTQNKIKMAERRSRPPERETTYRGGERRGQYCSSCGKYKQGVVYNKCLDCRTQSIKVQYKTRGR